MGVSSRCPINLQTISKDQASISVHIYELVSLNSFNAWIVTVGDQGLSRHFREANFLQESIMLERKKEPMGRCCGGSGVMPLLRESGLEIQHQRMAYWTW